MRPNINVSGQGARLNIGSIDQSTQHFRNESSELAAVWLALAEIRPEIVREVDSSERNDAALTVEQLQMELQRAKPQKTLIWTLLERLNTMGGLGEKLGKLTILLEQLPF